MQTHAIRRVSTSHGSVIYPVLELGVRVTCGGFVLVSHSIFLCDSSLFHPETSSIGGGSALQNVTCAGSGYIDRCACGTESSSSQWKHLSVCSSRIGCVDAVKHFQSNADIAVRGSVCVCACVCDPRVSALFYPFSSATSQASAPLKFHRSMVTGVPRSTTYTEQNFTSLGESASYERDSSA